MQVAQGRDVGDCGVRVPGCLAHRVSGVELAQWAGFLLLAGVIC